MGFPFPVAVARILMVSGAANAGILITEDAERIVWTPIVVIKARANRNRCLDRNNCD